MWYELDGNPGVPTDCLNIYGFINQQYQVVSNQKMAEITIPVYKFSVFIVWGVCFVKICHFSQRWMTCESHRYMAALYLHCSSYVCSHYSWHTHIISDFSFCQTLTWEAEGSQLPTAQMFRQYTRKGDLNPLTRNTIDALCTNLCFGQNCL